MDTLTGQKKFFQLYDKSLSRIETPQGTLTLVSVFLPFFVEMLLTNSMGTVNTLVLSHYSDEAVASVGAANQLMGMIFTFYTVISTGASIFISHRVAAQNFCQNFSKYLSKKFGKYFRKPERIFLTNLLRKIGI